MGGIGYICGEAAFHVPEVPSGKTVKQDQCMPTFTVNTRVNVTVKYYILPEVIRFLTFVTYIIYNMFHMLL